MGERVSVTRDIASSPDQVYAMVSDLRRMGEWSPENRGGEWLAGTTAQPGARFRGRNRHGWRSWRTVATVTEAQPGRRFSFRVTLGPVPVSEWSYALDPVATGCRVTESWRDLRPGWFRPLATLATGVGDRVPHNRRGMHATLDRLAGAAEAAGPQEP
jgi:uncharacterized protein YndB with AHSA1/START domain